MAEPTPPPAAESGVSETTESTTPVLSRKKQKKLARLGGEAGIAAHWEKKKVAYKERVKERRLQEKEKQQKEWLALSEEEQERRRKVANENRQSTDNERIKQDKLRQDNISNKDNLPQIIIDCDFEGEMDGRALKSMAQQVALSHSFMRRHSLPCWLTVSGLIKTGSLYNQLSQRCGFSDWNLSTSESDLPTTLSGKKRVVYLTGDSDCVLETLEKGTSYVVGGIIDRNRCKGLTLKKANTLGYSHARLPLDSWIQDNKLQGICKTLTTNHVVSILTLFAKCDSWEQSFAAVLPMRRVVEQQQNKKSKEKNKTIPNTDETPKLAKVDPTEDAS